MIVVDMLFVFVEYVDDKCFFGATVGRVTNRIKDARFELDGQVYELEKKWRHEETSFAWCVQ